MSIEKMSLVNIVGKQKSLDQALLLCVKSELFHPENIALDSNDTVFEKKSESNPYTDSLRKVEELLATLAIPDTYREYASLKMDEDDIDEYLENLYESVMTISKRQKQLRDDTYLQEQALSQVKHMTGLEMKIEDVFTSNHSKARFGHMPVDSLIKLEYFKEKDFFFFPFDEDKDYIWGVYIMPSCNTDEVDEIFKSLFFEQIELSDYIHGTPENAAKTLSEQIRKDKAELNVADAALAKHQKESFCVLQSIYSKIKMLHDTFNFRKYAVVGHRKFRLLGFVPQKKLASFLALFDQMDSVVCEEHPAGLDAHYTPPVKLKTNRLFRPFEMFVETYGLPGYKDMNPTTYIGIIYTILFGVMYGDFGQGACVILVGILMWKIKKMQLGLILTRCGVASMFFGLLYGSCFGFEGCFKPLFESIGLSTVFPLDVLDSQTSLTLLILSLGVGVLIILLSMVINVFIGFKKKDFGNAIFSSNGLAGLLLYGGIILAAILLLVLNINIFNPIFLIVVVLLPLILMFFHQPLGRLIQRHKNKEHEKFSYMDAAFEMIDIVLSYCTNTLSFLRVGGFILSHAALMLVVMQFAHMAGSSGSPIVIVLGNAFVMSLEGLIVSIQVLRLVYYETFSRFYRSDGKPFVPAKVEFKKPKK